MLQISGLSFRYPNSPGPQLSVPALSLDQGKHAVILGPSGCGKSTLLHLIAAILKPQEGVLRVGDVDLTTLSPRAADAWRGKTIGFMPQRLALVPSLTVRENLLLSAYARGHGPDACRADAILLALGVADKARTKPSDLSQGQQQRVAMARALYNRPALLLADEPTANLDDTSCGMAIELLRNQAAESKASLVIATHDRRVIEALPDAQLLHLGAIPRRRA